MTGQEYIHNNYFSNLESNTMLQKHKAAVLQSEKKPPHPGFPHPVPSLQIYLPANNRRYALNHFSGRLMATGYLGTDIAIEYLLGKYRTNQSVHTIRHAGGNILLFLSFLNEIGTNILTLSPQNIDDWIEFDQDHGLKVNSIIGRLRVVYAFIRFMVERDLLPLELLQKKVRIQQPDVLPRAIPPEDIESLLASISKVVNRH